MATESERLEESYRIQNIRFQELSAKTKALADKTLAATLTTTKLQAQTSAAASALRGISNVAPSLRDAITQAAKNSLFIGSALQQTTAVVKTASRAHDATTKELRRVKEALGEEANTISGINKVEKARKTASATRTELFNKEIEQIDSAITLQGQVIAEVTRILAEKQTELATTRSAIATDEALIQAKTDLIGNVQDTTVLYSKSKETLAQLKTEEAEKNSLISSIQTEIATRDSNITAQNALKASYNSQLSVAQASIASMQAELAGTSLTSEQRRRMAAELARVITEEARLQTSIAAVDDAITTEVRERITLADNLRIQQGELATLTGKIQDAEQDVEFFEQELQALTGASSTGKELTDIANTQLEALTQSRDEAVRRLGKLKTEENSLIKAVQDQTDALENATATIGELQDDKADKIAQEAVEKQKDLNDAIKANRDKLSIYSQTLSKVATNLNKLVAPILELQKQFGVSAGTAAKLKFENLSNAVDSYITSLITGGPAVGAKEIEATQGAFQQEFGGVLTSDAARGLAEEAKRMGVGASEMAKARRVFMTQTMGDTGKAKAAQDKFIGEFAKKGLTAKDAMAAIGQNSELLARNGTRFATSFARAAAEAKKIGVDLSKIDQVGDNIIGNFEGFLESQAELGAMGFGFDTNKLAELAESGDTGALMGELQSQLASTGKDITKLRRSEQLALSEAFGLSMEDLQRMGAPGGGSGEETLSPEELQKDANKSLGDLVFRADAIVGILGTIATVVAAINTQMIARTFTMRGANLRAGASRVMSGIRGSRLGTAVGGMGTMARVGTGLGVGLAGAALGAGGEKLTEAGYKKTGGAVSALGEVAKYAGIGMMFGPVGAAVGALVGAIIGVTKNFDAFKEMASAVFGGFKTAFSLLSEKIMGAGTWMAENLNPFNWIQKKIKGDDVVSKSGYGERTLVTPTQTIALNNNDNVLAYADDMVSGAANEGVRMLSYGALAPKETAAPQINIDMSRLEAKLDAVVNAIASMRVEMDGTKVGKILVNSNESATSLGVFRQGARATL